MNKLFLVLTIALLIQGCDASINIEDRKTPSMTDVVKQTSKHGARIICKSSGVTTFEVEAEETVNITGQNIVYTDKETGQISLIQNFAGQCMITPNIESGDGDD